MRYPKFFDEVETITMQDPLSDLLGVFENGEMTFGYLDVVKSAGHSCPTVAGAYLMTLKALRRLYPDTMPVRGNIKVEFKEKMEEGVAGVIGNVVAQITGATDKSGFKGLNGKFARHSLMAFNADIGASARFTRVDTGACVEVYYNPNAVPRQPEMADLMERVMNAMPEADEVRDFGLLWQERVERILIANSDNAEMIRVEQGC